MAGRSELSLLVLASSGCVCKSQHHEMLKSSSGCQHCPDQPNSPCLNSPSCSCFTAGMAQSPKTSLSKPLLSKKHFLLSPLYLLCLLLSLPVAGFFLCTGSSQMYVAKINPILPPLRDTLFMEPPASGSPAHSSGTSQAGACSEASSAQAEREQ